MTLTSDIDIRPEDVSQLTTVDALAAFFTKLGYDTNARKTLTPLSIGLTEDSAAPIQKIELLSKDSEGFLSVIFVQLRSLTAKSRNDLARVLGKTNVDYLLILTSDFDMLEFVLLYKQRRENRGPASVRGVQVIPMSMMVDRRSTPCVQLRLLRRLTWTTPDGLAQYDKLRVVFEAVRFSETYFQNRALFADYYLESRLKQENPAWRENPSSVFAAIKDRFKEPDKQWRDKDFKSISIGLYEPVFKTLGFTAERNQKMAQDAAKPEFMLSSTNDGNVKTAAYAYRWDRWLDGPDYNDPENPEVNPGASVVTALETGLADWVILTNGRLWRLYSRQAHSRATNFYEVDVIETLSASGDTDPNEAFRYWWLFFRSDAFKTDAETKECWLDAIVRESRDYAKKLGERLKDRIFLNIFPHLASGFLADRNKRLGVRKQPSDDELREIYEATLTLLYRLLFLLYAESRDLLPVHEPAYYKESLKKLKESIAAKLGTAEEAVPERLKLQYSDSDTSLYEAISRLFSVMDEGDPSLNVPTYNGGLFLTRPDPKSNQRDHRIARFLNEHKIPDHDLALAIDRLSRDIDDKTLGLVFIDYKSLGVRHLGSIYEGLLEFKLKIAGEDLASQKDKSIEKYVPLTEAKGKRKKAAEAVVRKGEVYLSNDKAERHASGSYYTPDHIVKYIVEHTVAPVLEQKLEALRDDFRKAQKSYQNTVKNATAFPVMKAGKDKDTRLFAMEKTYEEHRSLVDKLFDMKILDPAMGSAHFLVEAVDFITDRIITFLNQFPVNPVTYALERTRKNILDSLQDQRVAVNPDKLTDVNLLKRHVLKRCVYGVDINPMAVELAKVSLWLDAFTLGAPLSFLDHHLRCGNSLIGATFKELEDATSDSLFGLNYEPLKRAISNVLLVSGLTDATASEVHESRDKYDRARKELSGYQIILDLLAAKYFGYPNAAHEVTMGHELDLSDGEKLATSVKDAKTRKLLDEVETLALHSDLRFFHWELEFPEIFFGNKGMLQQTIEHKDKLETGSAGFDAVIGNPPYVRQEGLSDYKPFFKDAYEPVFTGAADLYVFFYHRGLTVLHDGGYFGMITSNKFMKAGYGGKLRTFLSKYAIADLIDFRDLPVFTDATSYPLICVVCKTKPEPSHFVRAYSVPDMTETVHIREVMENRKPDLELKSLRSDGWSLQNADVLRLLDKIRAAGKPLAEVIGGKFYRGILTGYNEAFVIDEAKRQELIAEDPKSAEIIKPFLRGRDIKRWKVEWAGVYLITTEIGVKIKRYPAIFKHLKQYQKELEERWDKGKFWWELRACDYYEEFEKTKIVYPDIYEHQSYAYDVKGYYYGNTAYFIPSDDLALLAILNSRLIEYFYISLSNQVRGGYLRSFSSYIGQIPIPVMNTQTMKRLSTLVESILNNKNAASIRLPAEDEIDDIIFNLYGLLKDEIAIVGGDK